MERAVYDHMARFADSHWWYVARRKILAAFLGRLQLPAEARILEIGCGTGHNLEMLSKFGTVDAVELDSQARAIAEERLGRPIREAQLPALPGIANDSYDLVALLDVLEHVDEDEAALRAIRDKLRADGHLLITVPAHPWLWSAHDTANHHRRRYTKRGLRRLLMAADFKIESLTYFNSLLFPAAAGARLAGRVTGGGREKASGDLPPAPLNWALRSLFGAERYAVGRIPLPPGLSLLALVSRP